MPSVKPKTKKKGARAATPGHSEKISFRNLVAGLDVGVAYLSPDGIVTYANTRFCELLGYRLRFPLIGRDIRTIISAASWTSLGEALNEATQRRVEGDLRVGTPEKVRVVRFTLNPAVNEDGYAIVVTAGDTTDLVNATDAVRDREQLLRTLTARILHVQDQERRKIARDLHDVTAQETAAIQMILSAARRIATGEVSTRIGESLELLKKIQEDVRTLSYVLHPPLLDERGLGAALRWYVEGFQQRSGIEVELDMAEKPARLPVAQEIALFRVVQEGLTNVVRHSDSTKARIKVREDRDQFELTIEDEGSASSKRRKRQVGDSLSEDRPEFGVGIPGMRERLSQLGGTLEFMATKAGTKLAARVPVQGAGARSEDEFREAACFEDNVAPRAAPARTRILAVDDHDVVLQGIRSMLAPYADLEICGEAKNGLEAIAKAKELQPDLLVLDLSMPGVGGLSAARLIRDAGMHPKILIFTTHSYPGLEQIIRAAHCDGLIQKPDAGTDLVAGIRTVMQGGEVFSVGQGAIS